MSQQIHEEDLLASMSLSLFTLPMGGSALERDGWLDM